jgi:hypothetical protein
MTPLLCLGIAFDRTSGFEHKPIRLGNEKTKTVDYFGSPCKGLDHTCRHARRFAHSLRQTWSR